MFNEPVSIRSRVRQLFRVAHPDEIGRQAAPERLAMWQNIPPNV
jgi:hypothetical protein